jgi:hypothetical protein
MPFTCEIPILDCFVRTAYLFDAPGDRVLLQIGVAAYADCVVSIDGRPLLFNVMLANGARFDRLPITALWCGQPDIAGRPDLPLGELQVYRLPLAPPLHELVPWNVMGRDVEFHRRSLMDDASIMYWHARTADADAPAGIVRHEPCQYLGTFDWPTSGLVPSEGGHHGHKCAHWLVRPDGHLALQPNNRIGVALASLNSDELFWRSAKQFRPAVRRWPDAFTSAEFLEPPR